MSFKQRWNIPNPRPAGEQGVNDALEYVLHESNKIVPHEEGTLQRSGVTDQDGLKGVVSYDTPYAVYQHENTNLSHDSGRQAKYLEKAIKQNQKKIRAYLAEKLGDAF